MKKIVWDLFGGLNGSVYSSLKNKNKYKVYTFDILKETKKGKKNNIVDLANPNKEYLLKFFNSFPSPDIIVASPMCNIFSQARRYKDGGTGGIIIDKKRNILVERNKKSWEKNKSIKRNDKWEGITDRTQLGKKAIENTLLLIESFEPKNWYIENPQNSLMWIYIKNNLGFKNGVYNKTSYGSYGFIAKKPTIFLSNIDLELKNEKWISKGVGVDNMQRKNRSDIPEKLIQDIFSKF